MMRRELLGVSKWQEGGARQLQADRSSCLWDTSRPYPMCLFI